MKISTVCTRELLFLYQIKDTIIRHASETIVNLKIQIVQSLANKVKSLIAYVSRLFDNNDEYIYIYCLTKHLLNLDRLDRLKKNDCMLYIC